MLAGGVTKYGTKGGLEHAFLDKKDHTLSNTDLVWGAVDGLSGVTASMADQRMSSAFMRGLGRRELGSRTSLTTAELAGKQLIEGSAFKGIQHGVVRGLAGGAAGSFTWSVAHQTHDNWKELTTDPIRGLASTARGVAFDTTIGTLTGGALGGSFTALRRSPELVGRAISSIKGDAKSLKINEFVINDFHSNLDRLPQLKTKLDERTAVSAAQGVPSEFNVAGDALSGHVNFSFTRGGDVENRALTKMGLKNIIPGNHEYDAPGGRFVPERYPTVMEPILADNPQVSLLNANLDLSAYPQYAKLTKPYVVHEVPGPNGMEKVATVGLITDEGAVGKIRYEDATATAIKTVRELNAQGIKNIKLLTHLGLDEDIKLARTLLDNNLVVAKISGGHTHDVVASPIWVSSKQSLVDRLKFWQPSREIPVTQAGSGGNYLAENHIVFNADGSANRWRTTGRLHGMQDVQPDAKLKAYIDSQSTELNQLKATTYDAEATAKYSLANARNRETPLGNLIADATLDGLQKRMGSEAPQIAMVHSGGIRDSIPERVPLSRQELSNVFMNAGRVEGERTELTMITMTGKQIKSSLEYGLRDYPLAQHPSFSDRLGQMFGRRPESRFDQPGNFVQVSGMKYSFDLTKQPWQRVADVQVKMGDGTFAPIHDAGQYRVVTRFHPVDKWNKADLFGEGLSQEQVYANLNAKPVEVSQVDLLGDFIRGRKINPLVDSKVEGRIQNVTPIAEDVSLRPQTSITAPAILSGVHQGDANDKR